MSIAELIKNAVPGGVGIIVVLSLIIQISPLKLNPWTWLGDQLNSNLSKRMDKIEHDVIEINGKLNAHIVESYRTSILDFADKVMRGEEFTLDKWRQMQKVCALYEHFIEDEGLINGDATEAIKFIETQFTILSKTGNFRGFPK